MVELEARPARPALPLDDGRSHRALTAPLPEALRSDGARVPRRARPRRGHVGSVPALAPGALVARARRGDRNRPDPLSHLPAARTRRAAGRAPRDDRAGP